MTIWSLNSHPTCKWVFEPKNLVVKALYYLKFTIGSQPLKLLKLDENLRRHAYVKITFQGVTLYNLTHNNEYYPT